MDLKPILRSSQNDAVRAFVTALELHEPGQGGHAERVAMYASAIGHKLGLDGEDLVTLRRAAALHDVGKIAMPRNQVSQLGSLTDDELAELKRHAELALQVVESFSFLADCVPMIVHHHERWDGLGYPDGLVGERIPLGARIIAVAETFDVLVSGGGYKAPVGDRAAVAEIKACAGTQFDPSVVSAFSEVEPLIQPLMA
ncbi:MAG: HD domain-containing protein [Fimbriimonadaceae bacterium]|jgi:putative nucleotidyltransferase with HDIG domain|nr:HD domain-containing protein [Fimbriimonadaceae bacterium]